MITFKTGSVGVRAGRGIAATLRGAAWLCVLALAGCAGGYTLKGKVVSGGFTDIESVGAGDDRLDQPGVGEVRIFVHRDPGTLKQELAATGVSKPDGTIAIPISGFGAGWMDETWLVQVERDGYMSGDSVVRLPGLGQRLLITVREGVSTPHEQRENLWEQYEQYK